jgi:hypothetical protein
VLKIGKIIIPCSCYFYLKGLRARANDAQMVSCFDTTVAAAAIGEDDFNLVVSCNSSCFLLHCLRFGVAASSVDLN